MIVYVENKCQGLTSYNNGEYNTIKLLSYFSQSRGQISLGNWERMTTSNFIYFSNRRTSRDIWPSHGFILGCYDFREKILKKGGGIYKNYKKNLVFFNQPL